MSGGASGGQLRRDRCRSRCRSREEERQVGSELRGEFAKPRAAPVEPPDPVQRHQRRRPRRSFRRRVLRRAGSACSNRPTPRFPGTLAPRAVEPSPTRPRVSANAVAHASPGSPPNQPANWVAARQRENPCRPSRRQPLHRSRSRRGEWRTNVKVSKSPAVTIHVSSGWNPSLPAADRRAGAG